MRFAVCLLLVVLAAPLHAGPSVTIYGGDLAFVREAHTFDLRGNRDTVRVADLPDRVDATSLRLALDGAGRVSRLAYRTDVAGGDDALDRARGARVQVASSDGRATDGTLLSASGAWLLLRGDDGALHALSRNEVHEVRFQGNAGGELLRPSLEAVIDGARRGRTNAELSYLTGGLFWSATHTLVRRGNRADWSATVTVVNGSGRDYPEVDLKLVAGDPRRAKGAPPPPMPMRSVAMESSAAADLVEETFSEYHLYTLPRPATLRDRESQNLVMIDPREVSLTPRYLYRSGAQGVAAQLEIMNTKANGLGVPLAGGAVRVYEPDASGAVQFAGEASIRHTPEGEKVTLEIGTAFDLAAERREIYNRRVSDRERELAVEFKLRNRKKESVTIVIEEPSSGETEVLKSSHPADRKDARTLRFEIAVPSGREVVVTYTARVRY